MKSAARCAIVIPSCEKYSDLWLGLSNSFKRYWADCSFDKYLISDGESAVSFQDQFKIIPITEDAGWSSNLKTGLKDIHDDYILLWIDDLFLTRDVDSAKILRMYEFALSVNMDYLRFNPLPAPPNVSVIKDGFSLGRLPQGDLYRTSTVCSLWRREVLVDLLDDRESAWEFEYIGSKRSDKYQNFFASVERNFYVKNTVVKGKWDLRALSDVVRLGLVDGAGSRPVMSGRDFCVIKLKNIRSRLFSHVPRGMRRRLREWLL
jgi:glycosyltransferase involved in cell wall biosynthesis